ncbi:MAG: hypothetical protein QM727_14460 [Niabella sp.]
MQNAIAVGLSATSTRFAVGFLLLSLTQRETQKQHLYISGKSFYIFKENPDMTRQDTKYFNNVKKHFYQFSNLPVVGKFDKLLRENLVNYFLLSGNAYGLKFKGDKLIPTNIYNFPAKGIGKYEIETNPIITYLKDLEEFVKKSNYRKFYKNHKKYYDELKTEYQKYATINEQKKWLETRFDYKINSYRVLTSPLIAGMNATHTFEDNGFKEMILFYRQFETTKN